MYIITFYSFKGGVGRTMALVNTGAELARRGHKVLLVDFDLEAPGLSTYELLRSKKPHPGIVEYVTEFRNTRRSPLVTEFIYETRQIGKKGGRLWVMPAGRGDTEYRRLLNALNWRVLYQDEEGFLLFEDTRLQWEAELHPDYVLIDARTGHTDIEGICTRQLANAVVVVFHPNEQNLAGLKEVCRHIRAEETSGLKKKIKLHFVASNVPALDDEDRLLRRHINQFRTHLMSSSNDPPIPIIHRNETYQMLKQPIFVQERPHSRLAREFRFLVRALQIENPEDREGALLFLREIQKDQSKLIDWSQHGAPGWYLDTTKNFVNKITDRFWGDAEVLFRVGQFLLGCQKPDKALIRFDRALALRPDFIEALFERGLCHRQRGQERAAAEDFLHYLCEQGKVPAGEPEKMGSKDIDGDRRNKKNNEKALLELFSISLDDFLKTLELPPVQILSPWPWEQRTSNDPAWLLGTIVFRLIQQRRWDDAIRSLEQPKIKALGESTSYAFYLAIAHWGKKGEPCREMLLQALHVYKPILDEFVAKDIEELEDPPEEYVRFLQETTILCWGVGDKDAAEAALQKTMEYLDFIHEDSPLLDYSSWTFRETSPRNFRQDCEEMARMIRGEPVRPAFLGPSRGADSFPASSPSAEFVRTLKVGGK